MRSVLFVFFFFQAEDGIRDLTVMEFRRVLFRSLRFAAILGGHHRQAERRDAQNLECHRHRVGGELAAAGAGDRKSTRLNSSHSQISYAVFCLKKKKKYRTRVGKPSEDTRSRRDR